MNPFVIHCTTCQARLKVNDESAIGGIFACPKCGSMVQVLPPPAAQTAAPVAATSPTKSKPAKPNPAKSPAAKLQVAKPLAEAAAAKTSNAAPVAASTSAAPVAASTNAAPVAASTNAEPVAATANTEPVAATAATKSATPPPLPARKADAASVAVAAALLPVAGAASTSKIALATGAAIKYARQEPWLFGGALAAGIGIGTVIWLAVASGGAAKAEPEPSAAVQTSALQTPTAPASTENHDQAKTRSQPSGKEKTAAAELSVAPQAGARVDPKAGAAVAKPADVLEPVVDAPQTAGDDEAVAAADAPADAAADEAAGTVDAQAATPADSANQPAAPRAGAQTSRQLEIESRLSGRVQSVEFRKVHLAQFALFISDLIAAPVEFDLPALKAAGKGPDSLVSVKLQKTTAAAALNAVLESHGLVYAVRGDRVVITTK